MSCYCDSEYPTMFNEAWRKAAKQHKCCECGKTIEKGQDYQYVTMVFEGEFLTYKTCEKCADLRDALGDISCPTFRGLQEEYFEYLNQTLPSGKRDEVYSKVFPRTAKKLESKPQGWNHIPVEPDDL